MNIVNGGAHADNGLAFQEFMVFPLGFDRFSEALRAGAEIFHELKKILHAQGLSTAVGDEGGFAPRVTGSKQALDVILDAVKKAGYSAGKDIFVCLDPAASEFYKDGSYHSRRQEALLEGDGRLLRRPRKKLSDRLDRRRPRRGRLGRLESS